MITVRSKMKSTLLLLIIILVLVTFILPENSFAWNKTSAATYAEKWALSNNPAWPYFSGNDCTNFISQSLNYGGIAMEATRTDRTKWYRAKNQNNAWIYGLPWTVSADFYTYFRTSSKTKDNRYYIKGYDWKASTTDRPEPPNNNTLLNVGDIVSYNFEGNGVGHTGIVTAYGTDNYSSSYVGDLVCYHSTNRKRIIWNVKHALTAKARSTTTIYCWGIKTAQN